MFVMNRESFIPVSALGEGRFRHSLNFLFSCYQKNWRRMKQTRQSAGAPGRVGQQEDAQAALRWHVMRSFGAVPLAVEGAPMHRLGRLAGSRVLVAACLPDETVDVGVLLALLALRDGVPGPHEGLVVIGWRFAAAIHDDLLGLNTPGVFLVRALGAVPVVTGAPVRFEPLRRLVLGPAARRMVLGELRERLTLSLLDYRAPPGIAAPDEPVGAGLAQLRWWAVDATSDTPEWNPTWQSADPAPARGAGRVPTSVQLELPVRVGARSVCIRALDADGVMSQAVLSLPLRG
jgi:adenine-specific DNA-methyltransferase